MIAVNKTSQKVNQKHIDQLIQIPKKLPMNLKIVAIIILSLLFWVGFYAYILSIRHKINQVNLNLLPTPTLTAEKDLCSQDNDCVIGIQTHYCCGCPKAIHKGLIGTNDWQTYEFGKDYSPERSQSCKGEVSCYPCVFSTKPICQDGQCQFSDTSNSQIIPPYYLPRIRTRMILG